MLSVSLHTDLEHQSVHKHVPVHLQSYTAEINIQPLFPLLALHQDPPIKRQAMISYTTRLLTLINYYH